MRRVLRMALVGVLVLMLGIDSAFACHFFRSVWGGGLRGWGHGGCRPAYWQGPVGYAGPCRSVIIAPHGYYDGYVDGGVVERREPVRRELRAAPAPPARELLRQPPPAETLRPVDEMPPPALRDDDIRVAPDMPPLAEDEDLMPPPVPMEPPPVEPPPVETPPVPALPDDDPFAPPVEMMEDDLFDGLPEAPAPEEFEPEPPTVPPFEENDVFAPPAEEPAEPVTPPVETEPLEDFEFFGLETAPVDEAPAPEEPAEEPAEIDDFGVFDFEVPAEEPAEEPVEPAEDAPATETEDEAPADEDLDFFDFGAVLREAGGLASSELRTWVDNTGEYSCHGRLIRFLDGKVRLLKDNGRTTTVPLYRLSQADLEFVHRQASAQQAEALQRTAQVGTMLPWVGN